MNIYFGACLCKTWNSTLVRQHSELKKGEGLEKVRQLLGEYNSRCRNLTEITKIEMVVPARRGVKLDASEETFHELWPIFSSKTKFRVSFSNES